MSGSINDVVSLADSAATQAARVGELIRAGAQQWSSAIHDLEASAQGLATGIDEGATQRRSRLQSIRTRVSAMHLSITHSLAQLDSEAQEIEQSIHHSRAHLDELARSAVHTQEELHAEMAGHTHAITDQSAHVVREGGQFADEVETMLDQLREGVSALHDHVASLDHEVVERVTRTVHDLQHVGERGEHLVVELAGRLRAVKGRFHDATQRMLLNDAIGALESSSRHLHESLDGLDRGALSELHQIQNAGGELLRGLEEVMRIVEAIRPALDMVHAMLG